MTPPQKDPGQKLFETVQKHVRIVDLAFTPWDTKHWVNADGWECTKPGLKPEQKAKWRKAAEELGIA